MFSGQRDQVHDKTLIGKEGGEKEKGPIDATLWKLVIATKVVLQSSTTCTSSGSHSVTLIFCEPVALLRSRGCDGGMCRFGFWVRCCPTEYFSWHMWTRVPALLPQLSQMWMDTVPVSLPNNLKQVPSFPFLQCQNLIMQHLSCGVKWQTLELQRVAGNFKQSASCVEVY